MTARSLSVGGTMDAMSEMTACGLPLADIGDTGQPVAALVVVKSFDPDGESGVCYQVRATDGLSTVEALGMADYAAVRLRKALAG